MCRFPFGFLLVRFRVLPIFALKIILRTAVLMMLKEHRVFAFAMIPTLEENQWFSGPHPKASPERA